MPDLVLELLKYVFLAVLYIFIARAVRAVYLELRPAGTARPMARQSHVPAARVVPSAKKGPRKVAIVEGDEQQGKILDLGNELLIGRADRCQLVLNDSYVSQMHARIFAKDGGYMIEDLGSTNGTYLNKRKVTTATPLHRGDHVKIGKTILELRK
jgi:hypothetical protein